MRTRYWEWTDSPPTRVKRRHRKREHVPASQEAVETAVAAAYAANEKLGEEIIALDVSGQLVITDVFLLISGQNDRQVKSIVDAVEETLLKRGVKAIRREGEKENHWVLLDFGDVVVHVQLAEERIHYALERLWKDCPSIPLNLDTKR